jgi:hypothetical protein
MSGRTLRGLLATAATVLLVIPGSAAGAPASYEPESTASDVPVAAQAGIYARENASAFGPKVPELAEASRRVGRPPLATAATAVIGSRRLCRNTSVRHSDRIRVIGYAQQGDYMDVERYSQFTNSNGQTSQWAVGTVRTQAGSLYGYVLYDGGTFC